MAALRTSKGQAALNAFAPELVTFIGSVSAVERCSALVVANALLLKAASVWGKEISHQPMKIRRETIAVALDALYDRYSQLEGTFDMTDGSSAKDVYVMACRWEMMATQVVMTTIGASLARENAMMASQAWKLLGKSRHAAHDAVKALVQYGKTYDDSPIPLTQGRSATPSYLHALATNLPPMFAQRNKVPSK